MRLSKKAFPKLQYKTAYADLTNKGRGILQQEVFNGIVNGDKLMSANGHYEFMEMASSPQAVCVDNDENIYIVTQSGVYMWCGYITKLYDGNFSTTKILFYPPTNTVLIASRRETLAYADGAFTKVLERGLSDLAIFRDRCFGLRFNKLYYTEQGSATDWSGCIDLPENCSAMAAAKDGIYIVGENVYFLKFDANLSDSTLTCVYRNIDKPLEKSLKSAAQGFMFYGEKGVQYFNGKTVKHVLDLPQTYYYSKHFPAAVSQGKYYVSFYFAGKGANMYVAVVDIDTQKLETVYNFRADNLWSVGNDLVFSCGEKLYKLRKDEPSFPLVWTSRPYTFESPHSNKSLEALLVDSASDLNVTLRTEKETRIVRVEGGKRMQKIPLHGGFRSVTLTVECEKFADVGSVGVVASLPKEEDY